MESLERARSQIFDLGGVIAMRVRDGTPFTLLSWTPYDESRALRNSHWRASYALVRRQRSDSRGRCCAIVVCLVSSFAGSTYFTASSWTFVAWRLGS